jgi:hypothetical protein
MSSFFILQKKENMVILPKFFIEDEGFSFNYRYTNKDQSCVGCSSDGASQYKTNENKTDSNIQKSSCNLI